MLPDLDSLIRLIREEFHPYHFQTVQALHHGEDARRHEFSHRILQRLEFNVDQNVAATVLWTYELLYTRQELINYHNNHIWPLKYHKLKK